MVMRELIKKAGHINDRIFLKTNESIFKGQCITFKSSIEILLKRINIEFIQMKCMILDENIEDQWTEIQESLNRQHIDEHNNEKKKIRQEPISVTRNTASSQIGQTSTTQNEKEESSTPSTITTVSESS